MADRAKVLQGLEQCKEWNGHCCKCPYHSISLDISECTANLCRDAFELLTENQKTAPKGNVQDNRIILESDMG